MAKRNGTLYWHFSPVKQLCKVKNLSGQKFGRLQCLGLVGMQNKNAYWLCRCTCKVFVCISGHQLSRGTKGTSSCGCLAQQPKSHGYAHRGKKLKAYETWTSMRNRCLNPRSQDYADYGGRGIKIYEQWANFAVFLADVGDAPSPKHSLDRYPDKNGNYEPTNVRWATAVEQSRNRRSNRMLTHKGETLPMAEWAERAGIRDDTFGSRIRAGWTMERALIP